MEKHYRKTLRIKIIITVLKFKHSKVSHNENIKISSDLKGNLSIHIPYIIKNKHLIFSKISKFLFKVKISSVTNLIFNLSEIL